MRTEKALLFRTAVAVRLNKKYRNQIVCFNNFFQLRNTPYKRRKDKVIHSVCLLYNRNKAKQALIKDVQNAITKTGL